MALGEILKQKRLEHGWTKEYVAERTNMMVRSIDALECENYKKIPAPIYGRGFIKHYCQLLGIDPQPLIEEYKRAVGTGEEMLPQSVTRPSVRDLPATPVEPIHTGAHRILPPKETSVTEAPSSTTHKLVASAEASFTSVPKPEDIAPTTPKASSVLQESPTLPEDSPLTAANAATEQPLTTSDPDDFFSPATTPKPHKEIRSARANILSRSPSTSSIFGPQHPVPDPPNPQLQTLLVAGEKTVSAICKLFNQGNKPKVRCFRGRQGEALITRRVILKGFLLFLTLAFLTVLVFGFRYVFRHSATPEHQRDLPIAAAPTYTATPVATPPEPYFN
ncbi:MAG: helix-turn-helix domain-containing protein [Kiritimatiellia bacterium]